MPRERKIEVPLLGTLQSSDTAHLVGMPEPTNGEMLMMELWASKLTGEAPYASESDTGEPTPVKDYAADTGSTQHATILPFRLDKL